MNIVVAKHDFTERWSCREGDLMVWLKAPSLMQADADFSVVDFWYMRDGQHVLVSNRPVDFPDWFTLHRTEVSGVEAARLMERLNEGFAPGAPVNGPNVWRVCAGDRVVWVGRRNDSSADANGVLAILDCTRNILVAGEGLRDNLEESIGFGALPTERPTEEQGRLIHAGVAAATARGAPRHLATEWLIG